MQMWAGLLDLCSTWAMVFCSCFYSQSFSFHYLLHFCLQSFVPTLVKVIVKMTILIIFQELMYQTHLALANIYLTSFSDQLCKEDLAIFHRVRKLELKHVMLIPTSMFLIILFFPSIVLFLLTVHQNHLVNVYSLISSPTVYSLLCYSLLLWLKEWVKEWIFKF